MKKWRYYMKKWRYSMKKWRYSKRPKSHCLAQIDPAPGVTWFLPLGVYIYIHMYIYIYKVPENIREYIRDEVPENIREYILDEVPENMSTNLAKWIDKWAASSGIIGYSRCLRKCTHLCRPVRSTFAVRETASLGIMGAPRVPPLVPPLNPSETILLWEHYRLWGV